MNASKEQVTGAGEIIFLHLYGGKNVKSLNQLRFQRFSEKISSALTEVDASTLPPTKDSADYHSLRVFFYRYACGKIVALTCCLRGGAGR